MTEYVTLAGGCFWCTEAVFKDVIGVETVESGYIGGTVADPSYRQVCGGDTGHAEAIRVGFDPEQVSLGDLFDIFFATHDPTQLNRQGNDVGTQYRSAIFPADDAQIAERYCVPTSLPCRLSWVGSWVAKKMSNRSPSETCSGSKPTRIASA